MSTAIAETAAVPKPRLRGWLHAAYLPVALVGAMLLLASAEGVSARAAVGVFGLTMIGLYGISSAYHVGRWSDRARAIWSRCDGAMIQVFIAGSFTPIAYHSLSGGWRTWSLAVAWTVAITGAVIALSPLKAPRWLSTAGYIAVGWLGVVPFTQIIAALPWEGSALVALGGVLYTIGGVVYARRWPDPFPTWFGFHEVFHVFVVAGSTAHYVAIWRYVLPS